METTFEPCSANETANLEGCDDETVPEWLEDKTVAGFRVWELAAIVISVLLSITIGLCCCIRFRIPRTKQEIEADSIRKKITKSFHKELSKIGDSEMDEMNLKKALELVQSAFEKKAGDLLKDRPEEETKEEKAERNFRAGINALIRGMRVRFVKQRPDEITGVI